MKFRTWPAVIGCMLSTQAVAQSVVLRPGEKVIVRIRDGQAIVQQRGPAAPMTKYDLYTAWRAETQEVPPGVKMVPPQFITDGEGPPEPLKPILGQVELTFRQVPGVKGPASQTALMIANGYNLKLRYRAVIRRNNRSVATDVCEILPTLRGIEHWPYMLDEIEISDIGLDSSVGEVRCK